MNSLFDPDKRFFEQHIGDRACVRVRVVGKKRAVIEYGIFLPKPDVVFAPMREDFQLTGDEGKAIPPAKGRRFFVSTCTIDPFHLVTEI